MRWLTPRDIGAKAREARISAGLTQAELGAKIGASRFWVAEFEHGKPRAELALVLKALRALNLSLTIGSGDAHEGPDRASAESHSSEDYVDLSDVLARSTARRSNRNPDE